MLRRMAARAPSGQRRPHPRRAPRGFRGGVRRGGLHLHHREGHFRPARWRLAAQKKSQVASERDEEARGLWRWLASRLRRQEAGVRRRERVPHLDDAPKGEGSERGRGPMARSRATICSKNTTILIAAITLEGAMGESMSVEGGTDALAFVALTSSIFLAPSLSEGQVVVLDGLGGAQDGEGEGAHRSKRGRIWFSCPSYSPDLNPIEEAFSIDKAPRAQGGPTGARGAGRSDRTGSSGCHARRCGRLVRPRRAHIAPQDQSL